MIEPDLAAYWRKFFSELFLGTFLNLFLFAFSGFVLGMACLFALNEVVLKPLDWNSWIEAGLLFLAFFWYAIFPVFHSLVSCVAYLAEKRLLQMVDGLHQLLDLLSRQAYQRFESIHKVIPKSQLEEQFDAMGSRFIRELNLKNPLIRFAAGLIFKVMMKGLKFFFVDDVIETLSQKPADQISRSDIEHAVRRVGVNMMITPISDTLLLLHILNGLLALILLGFPFIWYAFGH